MDSIAVTKTDMAVAKRDRLGLSLFGLLSLAFGDEIRTRSAWQTGLYREEPLALLEEGEPVLAHAPERELHLDVDLKVVLETLKKERRQADKRQAQAVARILERVYLLERRVSEAAPAQAHVNVRLELPREETRAARHRAAGAAQTHAADTLLSTRERSLAVAVQAVAAAENARQAARPEGKLTDTPQAGRTAAAGKPFRAPIGMQAAAAVRQARRAGAGRARQTAAYGQTGWAITPLTPVSWSTAAPAGEGWSPRWQAEHPGFTASKGVRGAEKGQPLGGSILLPDQLRLCRQRALEQAEAEAIPSGVLAQEQTLTHPHAAAQETGGAVRRMVQRLDRAVEQAVRRSVQREENGAGGGTEERDHTALSEKMDSKPARTGVVHKESRVAAESGKPDAAVDTARAARQTDTAAAQTEQSAAASPQNAGLHRAADGADILSDARPFKAGTVAAQAVQSDAAALPPEALLHRAEAQGQRKYEVFSGEKDARPAQAGPTADADNRTAARGEPDAGRKALKTDRGSAQTGQSDVAALQTMLAGYAAHDLTAAEKALPGAEAPQAALPQEALLHRVEGRERPLLSRGTDDGRFARGGDEPHSMAVPDAHPSQGRDAPPQSETETWVAQQAAEIVIPEKAQPPEMQTGEAQTTSETDFTGQDSTPRARAAQHTPDTSTEAAALPAEPLLYRKAAADPEKPHIRSGQQAAKQREARFALDEQTAGQEAGKDRRAESSAVGRKPAGANTAVPSSNRTAEWPAQAVPQAVGGKSPQAVPDSLRPAPITEMDLPEPLTWRKERAQTVWESAEADGEWTAVASTRAALTEGRNNITAASHTVLAEAAEPFQIPDGRGKAEERRSARPVTGGAEGVLQTDTNLMYRAERAALPAAAQAASRRTAAHRQGRTVERPRTVLRHLASRLPAHPIQPLQTTLVRTLPANQIAAARLMAPLSNALVQPQAASVQSAAADGNELSYLPIQAVEQKTGRETPPQTGALPEWAQRFLQQPPRADSQNTHRFSAAQQQTAGTQPGQIEWTAPGAMPKAAPVIFRENRQLEMQRPAAPARLSDSELRRAADKVYRMIEERLRRELRRSGK
ncbi:hypothetical protein [Agathobaculum massiliense]|uniref:hypothetical protein n=1 Tax=Agathobaculum massiliense TaxID=3014267 RepID=UPI0036F1B265